MAAVVTERIAIERFLHAWKEMRHLMPPGIKAFLTPSVKELEASIETGALGRR